MGGDPAALWRGRRAISLLPVTAPLFFVFAVPSLRVELTLGRVMACAAVGAAGSVGSYVAWPGLVGPHAPRATAHTVQV